MDLRRLLSDDLILAAIRDQVADALADSTAQADVIRRVLTAADDPNTPAMARARLLELVCDMKGWRNTTAPAAPGAVAIASASAARFADSPALPSDGGAIAQLQAHLAALPAAPSPDKGANGDGK